MYTSDMNLRAKLVVLSLALAACSGRENSEPGPTPSSPVEMGVELCPGARIVGVLEHRPGAALTSCEPAAPMPEGWRAVALFGGGSPGVAALDQQPPGELRRFCSYEWSGQGPANADAMLAVLDTWPGLQDHSVGLDCGTSRSQGKLDPGVAAAMHTSFRAAIGWLSGDALGLDQGARTPVEIAVVDTVSQQVSDDPTLAPHDPHGASMAALIGDITCPDRRASCLANIHHALALPRVDAHTQPDWLRGGQRGTPSDVALAIYEAVERWRGREAAAPRLVINLSIGWERTTPSHGPDRALEAALEYAACQGAVVFAAAGNGADPSCAGTSQGPLTPASFEAQPAPNASECRALGFTTPDVATFPIFGELPRPLVYAIGGIDGHGRSLPNARVGSRPRLAAPALGGLALGRDGEYTLALSGSSVAAAVATGAAALVWSYRPELSPRELAELLYESGASSNEQAEFGFGDGASTIHRLSVCTALERACTQRAGRECPQLECPQLEQTSDAGQELVRAAIAERRAASPDSVRVHRGAARVTASTCEQHEPGLAVALGG